MATWGTLRTTLNQRRLTTSANPIDIDVAGLQAMNDTLQELKSAVGPSGMPHFWDFDIRRSTITYYTDVEDYALPTDFMHIMDLQAVTQNSNYFNYVQPTRFDVLQAKGEFGDFFTIERRDRTERIRIDYTNTIADSIDLHAATGFDTNGTWTRTAATSDALNITTDTTLYKRSPSSINFDIDVSQAAANSATIYVPDMAVVDATAYDELGSIVMWFYIPLVTNITSCDLFWGSDTASTPATRANFWTRNVTTQADGTALATGWNKLRFDWNGATETGTVAPSTIRYLEFRVNYAVGQGDDTDFRINDIRLNQPEELDLFYYTENAATSTAGTYQAELTTAGGNTDETLWTGTHEWMRQVVIEGALEKIFHEQQRFELADKHLARYQRLLQQAMVRLPSQARFPELPQIVAPEFDYPYYDL